MSREIKALKKPNETSKSFDGQHVLEFSETSHRYKLNGKACPGTTTMLKAGYPTSVGLLKWMQSQAVQHFFKSVSQHSPINNVYIPNVVWPITEEKLIELYKEAKAAHEDTAREAADIGTICHGYAELRSLGQFEKADALLQSVKGVDVWPLIESCINKYLEWEKTNKGELIMAEGLIASPTYLYCGKFDRLDRVNGKIRLRDYKTSKDIYLDQFIQLGAYAIAIKEWLGLEVEELEVLRFGKDDGEFKTLLITDPAELLAFKVQAVRCRETYEFTKLNNDPRFDWKKK